MPKQTTVGSDAPRLAGPDWQPNVKEELRSLNSAGNSNEDRRLISDAPVTNRLLVTPFRRAGGAGPSTPSASSSLTREARGGGRKACY